MNILSELISDLKINGSVYYCDFLTPPWAIKHEQERRAIFHFVRRGRCRLEINGLRLELLPGDFAFVLPQINHHVTACANDSDKTLLLCGFSMIQEDQSNLLMKDLPDYIVIRQEQLQELPWLSRTMEHLTAEFMSEEPGAEITINKLTEILIIQLLRANFGEAADVGIITALRDKRLVKAMEVIHQNLSKNWTIESAAAEANLSRSGFARIFTQVLQIGFFEYLTNMRIVRARRLLESTQSSVASISSSVGYQSELSFIKVFKKHMGVTPRAFRQSKLKHSQ